MPTGSLTRENPLQGTAKAEAILGVLPSILTQQCGRFTTLNQIEVGKSAQVPGFAGFMCRRGV